MIVRLINDKLVLIFVSVDWTRWTSRYGINSFRDFKEFNNNNIPQFTVRGLQAHSVFTTVIIEHFRSPKTTRYFREPFDVGKIVYQTRFHRKDFLFSRDQTIQSTGRKYFIVQYLFVHEYALTGMWNSKSQDSVNALLAHVKTSTSPSRSVCVEISRDSDEQLLLLYALTKRFRRKKRTQVH